MHGTRPQADGYSGEGESTHTVVVALAVWALLPSTEVSPTTTLDELCGPYTDEECGDLLEFLNDRFGLCVPTVTARAWTTVADVVAAVQAVREPSEQIGA